MPENIFKVPICASRGRKYYIEVLCATQKVISHTFFHGIQMSKIVFLFYKRIQCKGLFVTRFPRTKLAAIPQSMSLALFVYAAQLIKFIHQYNLIINYFSSHSNTQSMCQLSSQECVFWCLVKSNNVTKVSGQILHWKCLIPPCVAK